jgi:hypothetical protein
MRKREWEGSRCTSANPAISLSDRAPGTDPFTASFYSEFGFVPKEIQLDTPFRTSILGNDGLEQKLRRERRIPVDYGIVTRCRTQKAGVLRDTCSSVSGDLKKLA